MALRRSSHGALFSLFGLFLFLGCATAPMVVRDGKRIPLEEAATADYQEGEQAFKKKRYKQAFTSYRRIVDTMPTSKLADNAMFRMAQIYEFQKQVPKAVETLQALTQRYDTGDMTTVALQRLVVLSYQIKQDSVTSQALTQLSVDKISSAYREPFLRIAKQVFDRTGRPNEKLKWLSAYVRSEVDAQKRQALMADLKSLIQTHDHVTTLEQIIQQAPSVFPSDEAYLRLMQLAITQGDTSRHKTLATRFLELFPGHEQYALVQSQISIPLDSGPKRIGVLLPMTGERAELGKRAWNALQTALDMMQLQNSPIQFILADVGEDPVQVTNAVNALVTQHQVVAVVGPLSLDMSKVVAELLMPHNVPMISLSSAEHITQLGPHVFRNSLTKSEQAQHLAGFAITQLGLRRMAILHGDGSYGSEFATLFAQYFSAMGGQVVATEPYASDKNQVDIALRKLVKLLPLDARKAELCSEKEYREKQKALLVGEAVSMCYPPRRLPPIVHFEGLFVPDGLDVAKQVIPLLPYYDIHGVTVMGPNLWNSPSLLAKGSEHLAHGTLFVDTLFSSPRNAIGQAFSKRYQELYQMTPGAFDAQVFDTGLVLLSLLRSGQARSRGELFQKLRSLGPVIASQGRLSVSPQREFTHELVTYMVEDGAFTELAPSPNAATPAPFTSAPAESWAP